MPSGGPLSGQRVIRYSHQFMPHCVEPMDAADDPSVKMIILWFARREGKTNGICLNVLGRNIMDCPANSYSIHPTDSDVKKFSIDDVDPMIDPRINPRMAALFVARKSRDSGHTIDFKKHAGGSLRIVSAGSETKFRGSTVPLVLIHEADALLLSSIYKAFGRTTGIAFAKIYMESTGTLAPTIKPDGTIEYHSVIHEHYEKGDMRKWWCQCKHCSALNVIMEDDFQFPAGQMEKAEYVCPRCDSGHIERDWYDMSAGGVWYPTAGLSAEQLLDIEHTRGMARAAQPEVRSYWRNGFTSLLPKADAYVTKLHEFVAERESAKSSPEALQIWTTEVAAKLWDPMIDMEPAPDWAPLAKRCEDYSTLDRIVVPESALVITGGGDVHPDRIEWSWFAWAKNEDCWVLDHQVFDGDTKDHSLRGPWAEFRRHLDTTFEHASGAKMNLDFGLLDASFGWNDVLEFIQTVPAAGKLRACRGSSQYPYPVIGPWDKLASGKMGYRFLTLMGHWIGTDEVKDILYRRFRFTENKDGSLPDGWVHFPKRILGKNGNQTTYFEQLCAERVEMKGENRRYLNTAHARNETFDTFVYGYAAFRRRSDWEWESRERAMREPMAEDEEEREEMALPSGRGGFGSGWNL